MISQSVSIYFIYHDQDGRDHHADGRAMYIGGCRSPDSSTWNEFCEN